MSASALDGFHPRHYGMLHPEGIEVLIGTMYMMELLGVLPTSQQLIVFAMLPKAVGFWQIAIF